VNKWDLVEKDHQTMERFREKIREKIMPFQDLPIIFISAKEQQRVLKMLDTGLEVYKNRQKRIPTSRLNEVMLQAIEEFPPPSVKGKYVKIKYVTQLPVKTPTFAFFCNLPQYIKDPYKRYLENRLRENFNFHGVPVEIFFRKK
jgi:GTP-binding protein